MPVLMPVSMLMVVVLMVARDHGMIVDRGAHDHGALAAHIAPEEEGKAKRAMISPTPLRARDTAARHDYRDA
jgi:hypothetical protein